MKKVKLKQGTLAWEMAKGQRIGSSEVFDIVKYYAKDYELQNCGINPETFRSEKPYTTAWQLYHKMLNDGLYKKEILAPEFAEYGHAIEPYGVYILGKGRCNKLRPGEVYIDDNLIASLDIAGIAEECDIHPFDYGEGMPNIGDSFVCEQKSMMPQVAKNGIPFKYIIQAQYQILKTKASFYILQIMILDDDTVFNRGRICEMSKKKRFLYLDEHLKVMHVYFQNNQHLAQLIETCLKRFFEAVANREEPTPYIKYDIQKNIIESIRLNSKYDNMKVVDYDLYNYLHSKEMEEHYADKRKQELQRIVESAMQNNACRFSSPGGYTGQFSKSGSFLTKPPDEVAI